MFGRARTDQRQEATKRTHEQQDDSEVARLRIQVARLENALAEVIAASDDVVSGMQSGYAGAQRSAASASFAAAWTSQEPQQSQAGESFFDIAETDQRARDWLLASR